MKPEVPSLDDYIDINRLQEAVSTAFPTVDSLRWFVRRHRHQLVEHNALIVVAGRMRFHPDMFKQTVMSVGLRAAA